MYSERFQYLAARGQLLQDLWRGKICDEASKNRLEQSDRYKDAYMTKDYVRAPWD